MTKYQICSTCVMDTTDPGITFNEAGVCKYCIKYEADSTSRWTPDDGEDKLHKIVDSLKRSGTGKEFDCILGLSGGVDSSYLAYKSREWGLRPLVVHVDAGWNSEVAVQNIQQLVDYCGYELHTEVIDWDVMRRLQVAYLRSGVVNQDVPQDHAFFAGLYRFASAEKVRYILSGFNSATEYVAVDWHGPAMDARNIQAIFAEYGEGSLDGFPLVSFSQYYLAMPFLKRIRTVSPLNAMPYRRDQAIAEMTEAIGWKTYGRKHGESRWTRFFQNWYLPERFGLDKRRPHLASQVLSGELTREQALLQLEAALYEPGELARDQEYIRKKLRLSEGEWANLMQVPARSHLDFANWNRQRDLLKRCQTVAGAVRGRRIAIHG